MPFIIKLFPFGLTLGLLFQASAQIVINQPAIDRWMYPFNGTPGTRTVASTFSALPDPFSSTNLDDRMAQLLIKFDTAAAGIPAGQGVSAYQPESIRLKIRFADGANIIYDPTDDARLTMVANGPPDSDAGRPILLHGVGFRNAWTAQTFLENSPYSPSGPFGIRNAYAMGFDSNGIGRDLSKSVTQEIDDVPWAVGQIPTRAAGEAMVIYDWVEFDLRLSDPFIANYVKQGLNAGFIWLAVTSFHSTAQQSSQGFPGFFTKDHPEQALLGDVAPRLTIDFTPAPLVIESFQRFPASQEVEIRWAAQPGFVYQVWTSPDLRENSWTSLQSLTVPSAQTSVWRGASASPAAFFRISRSSP